MTLKFNEDLIAYGVKDKYHIYKYAYTTIFSIPETHWIVHINGKYNGTYTTLEQAKKFCNMKEDKAMSKQIGGSHYKAMAIQPAEYIRENNIGWYEGNAIKYISRHKLKGGAEDIKKAIHNLEMILEEYSKEKEKCFTRSS